MYNSKLHFAINIVVISLILLVVGLFFWLHLRNIALLKLELPQLLTSSDPITDKGIFIEVVGSVQNPGVYKVSSDTRLIEVIEQAGGFTNNLDIANLSQNINLAQLVEPDKKYFINARSSSANLTQALPAAPKGLVNINTANTEALDALPGVGPATAQKLIGGRPYSKLADLLEVPGIGESTLEDLKNLISF